MKRLVLALLVLAGALAGAWVFLFPAANPPTVTSVPPAVVRNPAATGLPALVQADLVRSVTKLRQGTGAPGVSAAVVLPDGEAVAVAVGYADVEAGLALTPQTLMLAGSTGKSYCAATVMRLVAAGRLALDDRLTAYLGDRPWFRRLPNSAGLTVRMLLNHTGGLPQFLDTWRFQVRFVWDAWRGRDTGYPPETMLALVLDQPPLNAPGAEFHYSDLGYHLLGLVVEKVTGKPYYAVLQEEVLTPLGLTWIEPATGPRIPGLAAGYVRSDWRTRLSGMAGRNMKGGALEFNPAIEYTGGGLANNPLGLAVFYKSLLEARLFEQRFVDEMVRDAVSAPALGRGARYGLGLLIVERPGFGRYVGHSGWYPGYQSNAAHFVDHGFSVALQVNRDDGVDVYAPIREIAADVLARSGKSRPDADSAVGLK